MDFATVIIFCLMGAVIGFSGAVVGIGGGLIAIPILALFFNMPQQQAQGTGLVMIVSNVLIALFNYYKHQHRIDLRSVSIAVISNILFTHIFALFAQGVEPRLLRHLFALFLAATASYYLWYTLYHQKITETKVSLKNKKIAHIGGSSIKLPPLTAVILGFCAGAIGGFFGVGGSLIVVPVMTMVFGASQVQAQVLALSMVVPGCMMALATYAMHNNTHWLAGLSLAFGGMLVVKYGVRLAHQLPEQRLKQLFAGILYLTVILLIVF